MPSERQAPSGRFEAHKEWLAFEAAIAQEKSPVRIFTPQALMLVFLALGSKALLGTPGETPGERTKT